MIGVKIGGGLGNQMFQYSAARALALRHKTDVYLDLSNFKQEGSRKYMLDFFNAVYLKNVSQQDFTIVGEFYERIFHPEVISSPDQSFLIGLWQSEKYFEDYSDQIRLELTLKIPLSEKSRNWARKIQNDPVPVSIHIRRGDYLQSSWIDTFHHLPLEYYDHAVRILHENFSNLTLYIFSDDLDWCRKILRFSVPANFVDGSDEDHGYEDLELMKLCRHHIIANSTFSWWGAWLSEGIYSSCINIASDKFFAMYDDVKKRIPDRWIVLKS